MKKHLLACAGTMRGQASGADFEMVTFSPLSRLCPRTWGKPCYDRVMAVLYPCCVGPYCFGGYVDFPWP